MSLSRRTLLAAGASALAAPAVSRAQGGPVPVRVGVIPILATAPLFVAEREGWLKEAGIAPTVTTFESGPNMIQALASGTLDAYVAGVAPLAVARSRGIDVRVVAAAGTEENVFVAGPKLSPYFKPGVAPAAAFAAYRASAGAPARLATQPLGSVPNTTLQHWLWEVAKVAKEDVTVVSMGIDATQQAILVGAVEGGILREPAVAIVTGRNPAIRLVALGGEMFPSQPGTVLALTGAFLEKNAAASQGLVTAMVRAIALIQKEPDRVAPAIEAALGKGLVDTSTIRRALASPATKFVADPRAVVEPTAAMQRYQVKLGALDKEYPLDGLFDPRLYERAVAQ
jgi:NitT/TauT family transport system substrate-binding protein